MKKLIILASAVAGIFMASSCGKMLDVTPPNKITDEQVMNLLENGTDDQKAAILKAIVSPMPQYFNNYDRNNTCSTGSANTMCYSYEGIEWGRNLMGNDIALGYDKESYDLGGRDLYQFVGDYRDKNGNVNYCHWATYAYSINQANNVLGYTTEKLAATDKNIAAGRAAALLVRAYSYMCLMEEYQDAYLLGGKEKLGLPIYTVYDPKQETVERSSSEQTWNFIKKDINDAITCLKFAEVGYTAGRSNAEDIDLGVANFLLARASLLTGDWANCIAACDAIINNGPYDFIDASNYGGRNTGTWAINPETNVADNIVVSPVTNAFMNIDVNPECIFGYKVGSAFYAYASVPFGCASMFSTYSSLKSTARIDDRLYKKIPANDVRKAAFYEKEVGDYKFPQNGSTAKIPSFGSLKFSSTDALTADGKEAGTPASPSTGDFTKFRLSEVYLMKAEATAQNGGDGVSVLTPLLTARGTTAADFSVTGMDFIKLQWRIEMWGEGGREYYNNKRWGDNVDRTGSTVHPVLASWPANKMTLHIPERELQDNNKCVDNTID